MVADALRKEAKLRKEKAFSKGLPQNLTNQEEKITRLENRIYNLENTVKKLQGKLR